MSVGIYPGFELCSFEELPNKRSLVCIVDNENFLYGIAYPKEFLETHAKNRIGSIMFFIYKGNGELNIVFNDIKDRNAGTSFGDILAVPR